MRDVGSRPVTLSAASAVIGLAIAIAGALLAKVSMCAAVVPASVAGATVFFLGLAALGRSYFARKQAIEEELVEEYRHKHGSSELFEDADEAVRLATRANLHFVKYFVPFFTISLGLVVTITTIGFWRGWNAALVFPRTPNPLQMSAAAAVLFLLTLGVGTYFLGASQEPGSRWLRCPGGWMVFSGVLFLLALVAMVCEHFGWAAAVIDMRIAKISATILIALGAELVFSFVIEFYRPRLPGETERPLPESRILALFVEPGGIARNVAASLDYQFGFQVSEVWFYRFLERAVTPLVLVMAIAFWLQTCIVVVGTEENGIREFLGDVNDTETLKPGLYLKLPSPFSRIYTFPVEQIQEVVVGDHGDDHGEDGDEDHAEREDPMEEDLQGDPSGRVIVWSRRHHKGEPMFLTANRGGEEDAPGSATDTDKVKARAAPVSVALVSAHVPVYFKVKNLYDYRYRHRNPRETLEKIATREMIRYLAATDMATVISSGHGAGGREVAQRIQQATDEIQLGIDVVFVNVQAVHPPPEVGGAFDDVVAASEERHEKVLLAEAYAMQAEPQAEGMALQTTTQAEAYKNERVQVSKAEADRFEKQLEAHRASPRLFVLNSFLDVLETEGADVRKFVVAARSGREVISLNLEEKLRPDLLDLDLAEPSE